VTCFSSPAGIFQRNFGAYRIIRYIYEIVMCVRVDFWFNGLKKILRKIYFYQQTCTGNLSGKFCKRLESRVEPVNIGLVQLGGGGGGPIR